MPNKVLITGILGQDGSNLAEYLLNTTDHEVIGVYKRGSNPNTINISTIVGNPRFKLVSGDITDQTSMNTIVERFKPEYFINFAANSFVGTSWDTPDQVFNVNTLGVLKCLEAIRNFSPTCRFYSAGSSEEFGKIYYVPQNEAHRIEPVNPYAIAKTAARHIVSVYRESYKLYAIHGTLYNHEGPKRGTEFVTRKITSNVARILDQIAARVEVTPFSLGNIYAKKDWSDSRDMVRGIWLMLQQPEPKELILASGKSRTVAEFVHAAFSTAGIDGSWEHGSPDETKYSAMINGVNTVLVNVDVNLFRPTEVGEQCGDATEARVQLGWKPEISFDRMVREMVTYDRYLISKP